VLKNPSICFRVSTNSGLFSLNSNSQYINLVPYCTNRHSLSLPEVFSVSSISLTICTSIARVPANSNSQGRTDSPYLFQIEACAPPTFSTMIASLNYLEILNYCYLGNDTWRLMDDMDYLQDPEMWEDKLPQPYKTINRILRNVLEKTWIKIEEREIVRTREEARVKIPTGAVGVLLYDSVLVEVCGGIFCGDDSLMVVANDTTVYVLRCPWKDRKSPPRQSSIVVDMKSSSRKSSDVGSKQISGKNSISIESESEHNYHEMIHNENVADILDEMNMKYSIIRLEAQQKNSGTLFITVQLKKGNN